MSIRLGSYKTRGGMNARVVRIRTENGKWFFEGAIQDPETGIWVLHDWKPSGLSYINDVMGDPFPRITDYDLEVE